MLDLKKLVGENNPSVLLLIRSLLVVVGVGVSLAITVFLVTGVKADIFSQSLCLTNQCFERFVNSFSSVFSIFKVTGAILAGVTTFGGILIALLSYLNSLKTTALSNHLSHLSMFHAYVTAEIEKRSRLDRGCFDLLRWYNLIYSGSKIGLLEVSEDYIEFIRELNRIIGFSNSLTTNEKGGGYRYKDHQETIKKLFLHSGIRMHSLPRLDFHEAEGEVIDLIETVNLSFCGPSFSLRVNERVYL